MSETLLGKESRERRLERERRERLERERRERRERERRERLAKEGRARSEAERFVRDRLEKEQRDIFLEKEGLTIPETCHVASVGRSSVYDAIKTGQLAAKKWGRRTIILRGELRRYLAALPVANAEIKPPRALAGRLENLNRTTLAPLSPKVMKQRPAVSRVPPEKVRGRAPPPERSVRSAD